MLTSPLFVEKENGSLTKIEFAKGFSRKRVCYSENTYRDIFGAAAMGRVIPNAADAAADSISGAQLATDALAAITHTTKVSGTLSAAASSVDVSLSDDVSHYPNRIKEYIRWKLEFWDATTVGIAIASLSVTTTSGSAIIVVADSSLLTPGQAISGTGIPAGTTISEILPIADGIHSKTSVVLSSQATASGTVIATLTGSNCLGSFYEDEVIGWGGEVSFPL